MEQEEKFCDEVENVRELTFLGDRISTNAGHMAAVITRRRFGCIQPSESGKLLKGKRFQVRLKGTTCTKCVRLAILHGFEVWCLREN